MLTRVKMLAPAAALLLTLGGQTPALADGVALAPVASTNCATEEMGMLQMQIPNITGDCKGKWWTSIGIGTLDNGQSLGTYIQQRSTTGGLFVTCAFGGWTAYTDGQKTYIDGPFGVMWRKNNARLPYPYDQQCTPPLGPTAGGNGSLSGDPANGLNSGVICVNNVSITNGPGATAITNVAQAACGSSSQVSSSVGGSGNPSPSGSASPAPSSSASPSSSSSPSPSPKP